MEFKRGKNGDMTLQRTKKGNSDDVTKSKDDDDDDNDDDDDVNEDEGIVEVPTSSVSRDPGSGRGGSSAGMAVVSNPLYSGQSISTSKKTAQALRFLQKIKKISLETKNLLLLDIIDCAARDRVSLVETSFELLVLDHFKGSPDELYVWRPTTFDQGMDEFLEQCEEVAETLRASQSHNASASSTKTAGKKKSKEVVTATKTRKGSKNQNSLTNDDDYTDGDVNGSVQ